MRNNLSKASAEIEIEKKRQEEFLAEYDSKDQARQEAYETARAVATTGALNTAKTPTPAKTETKQTGGNSGQNYNDGILKRKYNSIKEWDEAEKKAEENYNSIRNRNDDVKKIAANTGWKEKEIQQIKNHIFYNEHKLGYDKTSYYNGRFSASNQMADSWNRMIEGIHNKEDIMLLEHEFYESKYESQFHCSYVDAHEATVKAGYPGVAAPVIK